MAKEEEGVRICFWNIAGVLNKCKETWEYLERFDIIGLMEIWIDEEKWKKIENNLSTKYEWECITVIKEGKKDRNKGGVIMVISKELRKEKEGN